MREPVRPFVKWAGGKRQLLSQLVARCPAKRLGTDGPTYFEPFVGGGALFFALRPKRAVLMDMNERLVRTYTGVRDDVDGVVERLEKYRKRHDEKFFYEVREKPIDREKHDAAVAAWFIYLNKAGYNGLYRVNRANRFNVPFGRYDNPKICDETTLRACSEALKSAEILHADFRGVRTRAMRGDFVYFDPPYVPLSATSSFTSYTAHGFSDADQRELRDLARELFRRRVGVLLSNSSAKAVLDLYEADFDCKPIGATRSVNSKASARGAIDELMITPR